MLGFEFDKIGACGTAQWVLGVQEKERKGMVVLRVVKLVKPWMTMRPPPHEGIE